MRLTRLMIAKQRDLVKKDRRHWRGSTRGWRKKVKLMERRDENLHFATAWNHDNRRKCGGIRKGLGGFLERGIIQKINDGVG